MSTTDISNESIGPSLIEDEVNYQHIELMTLEYVAQVHDARM